MGVNLRTINKNLNYIKRSYRYYFKEVMDCGSGFYPRSALSGQNRFAAGSRSHHQSGT
jgi:hypothetical protein